MPRCKMNEKNCKWCINAKVTKGELVQCKYAKRFTLEWHYNSSSKVKGELVQRKCAKQILPLQQVNENKDFDRNGDHQCGKFERA